MKTQLALFFLVKTAPARKACMMEK